jgi:hypothetical protein
MIEAIVVALIVAIVMGVISFLLMPKPKNSTADISRDFEFPTADAGRPVPVPFGQITTKGPNCMGYWDVNNRQFEVDA